MNLNKIRQGELKPVFDAVEEGFNKLSIDFYLIGAFARDVWYAKGNVISTGTRDVDFAVFISNQEDYNLLKTYLVQQKKFVESKTNAFVIISPEGFIVDILPFGEIEIDDKVNISGEGLTSIHLNGFKEVYKLGTKTLELETGHAFEVATLPSIVLLKLISYDDRPDQRLKDPRDIASIIQNYFEISQMKPEDWTPGAIDAIATRSKDDKRLAIKAVNYAGVKNTLLVRLQGSAIPDTATVKTFTIHAELNEAPSMERRDAIRPVEGTMQFVKNLSFDMAPYSVLVVEIDKHTQSK